MPIVSINICIEEGVIEMRRISRKLILFLILSIFVATIFFVGCGKSEDVVKETNSTKTEDTLNNDEEKQKIIVGTSGAYAPWSFKKDDKLQGFEIDIWNEIAKRNDIKVEFKLAKFSGLLGMLNSGQIDTIAHQMSITEERKELYNFTEPYAYSYYDFAVKKDSPIKSVEDLKGKKVGCWLGGNGEATLRQVNEEHQLNLDIKTYDGAPIEKEVELDRLDACWQGEVKTKTVIEQEDLNLRLIGEKLTFEVNAYPFTKDEKNNKLIEKINKTIKEMHEDGTLSKLSQKWFGLDTTKKQN